MKRIRVLHIAGQIARQTAVLIAVLVAALITVSASAVEDFESLADPEKQARYAEIIKEVRCLTCLNRSIAESETPLAHDLRREIRDLIEAGASDSEVVDFLTARYGDFVMYRPPVRPRTYALWAGPIVFLLFGAIIFAAVLRRRTRQPIEDDEVDINFDNFAELFGEEDDTAKKDDA